MLGKRKKTEKAEEREFTLNVYLLWVLLMFLFGGNTSKCSELTPGIDCSWQCSRDKPYELLRIVPILAI